MLTAPPTVEQPLRLHPPTVEQVASAFCACTLLRWSRWFVHLKIRRWHLKIRWSRWWRLVHKQVAMAKHIICSEGGGSTSCAAVVGNDVLFVIFLAKT